MKLGRVWDYVMRRKLMLFGAMILLGFGGVLGVRLCANLLKSDTNHAQNQVESTVATYNNNLILKILNKSGAPSYTLSFGKNFQQATVAVSAEPLATEAFVRIFDTNGKLVAGEYTTMRDPAQTEDDKAEDVAETEGTEKTEETVTETENAAGDTPAETLTTPTVQEVEYVFDGAPKTYTVVLQPGYVIELRAQTANFYSTLDGRVVANFAPAPSLQRYVVMENGLRKEAWSELESKQVMSNILRDYLCGVIQEYAARVSDEVLNNKKLDTAEKSKILLAYHSLAPSEQTPYAEFIAHLQRGGSPVITYLGETSYPLGTNLDLLSLVTLRDNEDGELSKDRLKVTANLRTDQVGDYEIVYTAKDSDENETTLAVQVKITDPNANQTPGESLDKNDDSLVAETPRDPALEEIVVPNDPGRSAVNLAEESVGGGVNLGEETTIEPQEPANAAAPTTIEAKTQTNETKKTEEKPKDEKPGPTLGNIILLVLGIVAMLLVIRFIFDHYVR